MPHKGTVTLLTDTRAKTQNVSIPDLCGEATQHWIAGHGLPGLKGLLARLSLSMNPPAFGVFLR
jgi:hypothetical protein